ncbi:hypothetical protein M430DRAFT_218763 [Amorphotheca resinae ATCC 22711]|uniref:Uncharacterized protein n=1 Tax=Amorphotheca resinae ATCC 22711 TaxID=857342 RepID=A0A2T3B583_AMORE|nr:hypothetical protein M430DRAFT_218763 [Amorphotheca resinae ATCC 22711]PSS21919.1 hypothetical protein M430DRAFT_218763 [Amorphotheca resinae ATCC 22711]
MSQQSRYPDSVITGPNPKTFNNVDLTKLAAEISTILNHLLRSTNSSHLCVRSSKRFLDWSVSTVEPLRLE